MGLSFEVKRNGVLVASPVSLIGEREVLLISYYKPEIIDWLHLSAAFL